MKKTTLLILFVLSISFNIVAQEINWVTFEEAIELQKKEPRKIIMDAYTNWCGPCKILDKNTFHNTDLVAYVNENYYAVKFNAEGNSEIKFKDKIFTNPEYKPELANRRNSQHEFSRYLRIQGYPTIVFLDENGDLLAPLVGYKTPQILELFLKLFKNDDYKDLKNQEDFDSYAESFKSEFRDESVIVKN